MTKTKTRDDDVLVMERETATGFRPAPSTRRVEADPTLFPKLTPEPGLGRFWAEISDDLTIADQKKIPVDGAWTPILQRIAPLIHDWNAYAHNEETGEWEPLPAPAVGGWEVLERVRPAVAAFLTMCLKYNMGGTLPKEPNSSSDTDAGKPATG
jgi:hypothetical protein